MRSLRRLAGRSSRPAVESADLRDRPLASGFSPDRLVPVKRRFPILSDPDVGTASALGLPPTDLVLGVVRGDEARAYPLALLWEAHVVNDHVGGRPILVSFCGKCRSGVAFDPVVEGSRLVFELFGYYEGNIVLADDRTGTLWASLTGKALAGSLVGHRLEMGPAEMTTLEGWTRSYPASLAPVVEYGRYRVGGQFGPWVSESVSRWDDRLDARALVLGVRVGEAARAYVLDDEAAPGPRLLQDELAGVPIVLMARPGAYPLAYDRRVAGRVLTFHLEGDQLVDDTGSVWVPGRAVSGDLTGERASFVPSQVTEWYTWAAYHPTTELAHPLVSAPADSAPGPPGGGDPG